MTSSLAPRGSEFLLYQTDDGQTRVEVRFDTETVWLSLGQMAELFQRDKSVISRHIKNVFEEAELQPEAVVANLATTAADGKTYQVDYYNLDVIISVGYRAKSLRGTQFRTRRPSRRPSPSTSASRRRAPRRRRRSRSTSKRPRARSNRSSRRGGNRGRVDPSASVLLPARIAVIRPGS